MTAYTKYEVGNKLFVIEWLLSVDDSEDQGDFFEARDCELLSISSFIDIVSGSPVCEVVPYQPIQRSSHSWSCFSIRFQFERCRAIYFDPLAVALRSGASSPDAIHRAALGGRIE